jgi:hypothetical protein
MGWGGAGPTHDATEAALRTARECIRKANGMSLTSNIMISLQHWTANHTDYKSIAELMYPSDLNA